jgi:pantothenate kinase
MDTGQTGDTTLSLFARFSREEWGRLRATTSLSLAEADVQDLRRISEHFSLQEATEVYLPPSSSIYL